MELEMVEKLCVLACALLVLLAPGLTGATDQIRPGGAYTVNVTLRKPSGMSLDKGTWEVRAYFYSGTNCFNVGEWWQPTGSTEYLYTGWWTPRYPANGAKYSESWTSPDERTIPALVIPVLSENVSRENYSMRPPQDGEMLTLRVRLRLKNMNFERKDNYIEFRMGGKTYRPEIDRQVGTTIYLKGGGKLDTTSWELDIDQDTPVVASLTAPQTGSFSVVLEIPSWPAVAEAPLPVIPVVTGIAVIVVCALIAVIFAKRARGRQMAG